MRVTVKPELIRWACDRAGYEPAMLAAKFPHLAAWQSGDAQPTLKQIERFAASVHAPIGFLFLQQPPIEKVPIPDFRTVANERMGRPSPDLLDTLYICQQRQEWYRDYARAMGDTRLPFVGTVRATDDVVSTANLIRSSLSFDVEERRALPTWTEALRRFVELADSLGVLVMTSGVVGSNNRRKLDPHEFRGFALADDLAPLVFVNGADTKAAQMFTLAHELVHIWLGQSALSDVQPSLLPRHEIERWCNRVAAELLVPLEALKSEYKRSAQLQAEMNRLARVYKVSTLVILRRIHDSGRISQDDYRAAYEAELARLTDIPKGSGGDFYLTLAARASKRFARALVASTLEGRSSFTEALRLLGFRKMATFNDLGHTLGMGF
jgi:Zn-dependent peptidase ImmA (M78 family)